MKRLWLLTALLLVAPTVSSQEINIDPSSNPFRSFGVNPLFFEPLGQSFTAVTANIRWIGMLIGNCSPPTQFQLTLLEGSGTSGIVLATRTATAASGFFGFLYFDFSGTTLTVGNAYTAVLSQISPNPPTCAGTGVHGTSDVYSGGTAFSLGQPIDADLYLRVLTAIFDAQLKPPLNPDGSSAFKAGRVVPVKFTLTADGAPTCNLPPAEISLASVAELPSVLLVAPFRISGCQYIYNLRTRSLSPGTYQMLISLTDSTPTPLQVGGALFTVD